LNEWLWSYDAYEAEDEGQREALCTLGNGYVASRGALPECDADGIHYPGTYLAGIFNRLSTEVSGRTVVNESIVNAPNWLVLRVRVPGGTWFHPDTSEVLEHHLEMNTRRGELTRRSRLRDHDGRVLSVTQRRLISLRDPHHLALETTVVPENFEGPLEIESALDGTVTNSGVKRYKSLDSDHLEHVRAEEADDEIILLEVRTNDSGIAIAEAARTRVCIDGEPADPSRSTTARTRHVGQVLTVACAAGQQVTVEKIVAIYTSVDNGIYSPTDAAVQAAKHACDFEKLLERHITSWGHAWNRSSIKLSGDVGHTARVLNLHIFHLLQTVSKNTAELDAGVPARGLHGEAYRGHIFWDELFIFPLLTMRVPELTRALLRYRARRLDRARRSAYEAGFKGAMYPWQSGSDGREETQTLHLNPESGHWLPDASHLQRHINAAVAVNLWRYWQATTDLEFLRFWGAEMLLEIARFWASATTYNHALDRYEITGVMGPDEYHEGYPDRDEPGLDNNAYTNVMAVWCLCRAFDVLEVLPISRRHELEEKLNLTREELDRWGDISRKMHLCFHGDRILSQFEGYDDLEELDWEAYRARYGDIGRLDRILEAEGDSPNRYKLSKQADALMLFYVLTSEELVEIWDRLGYEHDADFISRNVEYYEARTSHGSTLSQMVHAWLHSRMDRSRSWNLFRDALASDINDVQGGTTTEGIHLGAMAGTVDLVQRCYGGVDARSDVLYVNPRLPEELHELCFSIIYRHQPVNIEITRERICVRIHEDTGHPTPVAVDIRGEFAVLEPGDMLEVELPQ
jgi:alpha,alpha-trehalase